MVEVVDEAGIRDARIREGNNILKRCARMGRNVVDDRILRIAGGGFIRSEQATEQCQSEALCDDPHGLGLCARGNMSAECGRFLTRRARMQERRPGWIAAAKRGARSPCAGGTISGG